MGGNFFLAETFQAKAAPVRRIVSCPRTPHIFAAAVSPVRASGDPRHEDSVAIMSRAFVKEPDGEDAGEELPERPISPHPYLVTAEGQPSRTVVTVWHWPPSGRAQPRIEPADSSRTAR
jgi:hypothetical protein